MSSRRRPTPAIHQFHASSAYGDAVTNSLLLTQELLRELGFRSEIYVEHVAPRLRDRLRHSGEYRSSPENVLLVHHSMGHDLGDWVLGLRDRKVLVYHNITPAEFFPDDPFLQKYSELGRRQLALFRPGMLASISDSQFNADELEALGYEDVTVLPLLFDIDRIRAAAWDGDLVRASADTFTVLFVGRVERNKCQHDLIEVFRHVAEWIGRPSQLVLVGHYNPYASYVHALQQLARDRRVADRVRLLGHVPYEHLHAWYRAADVFLCMSEHEGFGVPLMEAMALDVPVVAYASSNVPHTMAGAGILVHEKRPDEIAALLCLLDDDRPLRRAVLRGQRARVEQLSRDHLRGELAAFLGHLGIDVPAGEKTSPAPREAGRRWQVEGPLETSYSLAIVNRETALALERAEPGSVSVFATEGPGDYAADPDAIQRVGLETLWRRARKGAMPSVLVRNLYPPRVADMDGLVNLLHFAWEESALPRGWVDAFNQHLDVLTVPSRYVKKVLVDAGVHVPIRVVGYGLDHLRRETAESYPGSLGHGFHFLHVSSGFPRKGIDALLDAWTQAFSASDDVTLVLKTSTNPHNRTAEQVAEVRTRVPACATIVVIEEDLRPGQLLDLYRRCDAFVAPSRGEGFGLPMGEAMLVGIPVITTAYGGQADFCTADTSFLVDYRFGPARTHFQLAGSVWVEPDVADLARAMRAVVDGPRAEVSTRVTRGRAAAEALTWDACTERLRSAAREREEARPLADRPVRLGWVSTWNSKCGIAMYSRSIVDRLPDGWFATTVLGSRKDVPVRPDEAHVIRCWDDRRTPDLADLEAAILRERIEAVVFQFNFSLFALPALGALIERLHDRRVRTLVEFHSTEDVDGFSLGDIRAALACTDRLLVHGVADLNALKRFGLVDNVALFPLAVVEHASRPMAEARKRLGLPAAAPIVTSYGFLLPHKGIEQLIEAFPLVLSAFPDARLLLVNALYPLPDSDALRDRCAALVDRLGVGRQVTMVNEFLDDEETFCLLEAADLVVFPYQATAESASAAVRSALASGRPVACTPLEIFRDVADVVHRLPGTRPTDVAAGIVALLGDPDRRDARREAQQSWLAAHSRTTAGRWLGGMIRALVHDREEPSLGIAAERSPTGDQDERTACSASIVAESAPTS